MHRYARNSVEGKAVSRAATMQWQGPMAGAGFLTPGRQVRGMKTSSCRMHRVIGVIRLRHAYLIADRRANPWQYRRWL